MLTSLLHPSCWKQLQQEVQKYRLNEFNKKAASHFQKRKYKFLVERIEKVDKRAIDWLSNIPRCKWALVYDKGKRYGIMTTNSAESLNSMLSDFRGLLVTALVSRIFLKLVYLFDAYKKFYKKEIELGLDFTKWCRGILKKVEKIAQKHQVTNYNRELGIVHITTAYRNAHRKGGNIQVVKLHQGTCTCGKFQKRRIPCSLVIAFCMRQKVNRYQYVSDYYKLSNSLSCWMGNF